MSDGEGTEIAEVEQEETLVNKEDNEEKDKNEEESKEENNEDNDDDEEEEEGEEETYTVEAIRGHRTRYGVLQFHIKWEGYDEGDNTWEDYDHCDCPELIRQYAEKQKELNNVNIFNFRGKRGRPKKIREDDEEIVLPPKSPKTKEEAAKQIDKSPKKLKPLPKKDKKEKTKSKEKSKRIEEKSRPIEVETEQKKLVFDKTEPIKIPFDMISPGQPVSNPLLDIRSLKRVGNKVVYIVKRRGIPEEEVDSEVLRKAYPDALFKFLEYMMYEEYESE